MSTTDENATDTPETDAPETETRDLWMAGTEEPQWLLDATDEGAQEMQLVETAERLRDQLGTTVMNDFVVLEEGVTDDDLPVLVDLTPPNATTGDILPVRVEVTDNIGVDEVSIIHHQGAQEEENASLVGTNQTGLGNGTYEARNIVLPEDSTLPVV